MKPRNFVYDLIEDSNIVPKPDIKVILTDYVDSVGHKGDLVSVPPHSAYKNLLLPGLAVYDNPENRKKYDTDTKSQEIRRSPFVQRTINVFQRRLVSVTVNKTNSWTLEPWHVRISMRKAALYVKDDAQIRLPKEPICGPDPAKEGKEFFVAVMINGEVEAHVRCRIHHYTSDPKERAPYVSEHWKQPAELLFPNDPEQLELLAAFGVESLTDIPVAKTNA